MSNPVIEESGSLALSIPVTLHHDDGTETGTRATFGRAPADPTGLDDSFSETGIACWTPAPASSSRVRTIDASPAVGDPVSYAVIESDRTEGAVHSAIGWSTVRHLLREIAAAGSSVDFDLADFLGADFA